jgi:type II secretory pathway component PulK
MAREHRKLDQLKKLLDRLPHTYMGFPVDETGNNGRSPAGDHGKRGIALIIAIMIISVMMLFTSDLILSSQVNITLASTNRDNIKAEYMAKSGMNAALLLLTSDLAYDLYNSKISKGATLSDGLGDIWSAMNGLPIGGETLEMMTQFQESFDLNAVMDSKVMDQLKLFDGAFVLDVTDESQRINLNLCKNNKCAETLAALKLLFACPAEKAFLDEKKLSGDELAYRIRDWIDTNATADEKSGYSDEDEPYAKREPKMLAKNAPMDSLEELRLVEGWDEEVHAVFAPFLTIFPYKKGTTDSPGDFKINLNTASRSMLQCIFPESKGDCQEKSAIALAKRNRDNSTLGAPGQKVEDVLKDALCYQGASGQEGETSNKANWFTQHSMVYRIETRGNVGDSEKKLVAVVERTMPDVKKNEKRTFRILYLKVI